MRDTNAVLISKILKVTGFRFSKNFRHGTSLAHRVVFGLINTVKANQLANGLKA